MADNFELHQLVEEIRYEENREDFISRIKEKLKCPFLGIALATLSSLFFSLCSVIVKKLSDINPVELALFRFIGVFLPAIPIAIYCGQPLIPEKGQRNILLLRSFMGTSGLMLSFYAFRHIPLADASVIIFSTPVFVVIFARLFLREPCTVFNVITIILTLIGVVLITRPPILFSSSSVPAGLEDEQVSSDKKQYIWGSVSAIASTLFGANVYILLRKLKDLHFSVIMTNFGGFAIIYTLIVCVSMGVLSWPKRTDSLFIVLLGLFSFFGQILLTLSLQFEQAGPVSIARTADIVFAFVWQIMFFNEIPTSYSILGAILVISSVILTALKKWIQTLPDDNSVIRKGLRFLTISF